VTMVASKPSVRSMSTVVSACVVTSTPPVPAVAWVASSWQAAPTTAIITSVPLLTMPRTVFVIAASPLCVGGQETSWMTPPVPGSIEPTLPVHVNEFPPSPLCDPYPAFQGHSSKLLVAVPAKNQAGHTKQVSPGWCIWVACDLQLQRVRPQLGCPLDRRCR